MEPSSIAIPISQSASTGPRIVGQYKSLIHQVRETCDVSTTPGLGESGIVPPLYSIPPKDFSAPPSSSDFRVARLGAPNEELTNVEQCSKIIDREDEAGTFRILVTTDTHLGFKSDDSVRGSDSFVTFEEILSIGRRLNVDFVLHGGDLFDENKPSRSTIYRTMCLLRRYCLGESDIQFDVVMPSKTSVESDTVVGGPTCFQPSQASANLKPQRSTDSGSTPAMLEDIFRLGLNYLDGNVNVSMPFFAMHGNHDDPGEQSNLSPLDLLEAAHLINYFGRCSNVDDITVRPILFKKGQTKLAVYGFGWIRDERLHRLFNSEKVRFVSPEERTDDWFNIMVVHQNMYKGSKGGQPSTNCIHEHMLPRFLDLAIWGHEHDCHVTIREACDGEFQVLQPGSSIATSLVPGEAMQKHVFLLEIRGEHFRVTPYPLRTVRPLLVEDVILADVCGPNIVTARADAKQMAHTCSEAEDRDVWQVLTDMVEDILQRHRQRIQELDSEYRIPLHSNEHPDYELFCNYVNFDGCGNSRDATAHRDDHRISMRSPERIPLVRLRVEHTGFDVISTSRFGAQFIGRAANPGDILHFYRKKAYTSSRGRQHVLPDLEVQGVAGSGTSEVRDIVFHYLEHSHRLDVLSEPDLNEAVQDFAIKMDAGALADFVDASVRDARRHARAEIRKRTQNDDAAPIDAEDAQAIISDFTHSLRLQRLHCSNDIRDDTADETRSSNLTAPQVEACSMSRSELSEIENGSVARHKRLRHSVDEVSGCIARASELQGTAQIVADEFTNEAPDSESIPGIQRKRLLTSQVRESRRGRGAKIARHRTPQTLTASKNCYDIESIASPSTFESQEKTKMSVSPRDRILSEQCTNVRQADIRSMLPQVSTRSRYDRVVRHEANFCVHPSVDVSRVDSARVYAPSNLNQSTSTQSTVQSQLPTRETADPARINRSSLHHLRQLTMETATSVPEACLSEADGDGCWTKRRKQDNCETVNGHDNGDALSLSLRRDVAHPPLSRPIPWARR